MKVKYIARWGSKPDDNRAVITNFKEEYPPVIGGKIGFTSGSGDNQLLSSFVIVDIVRVFGFGLYAFFRVDGPEEADEVHSQLKRFEGMQI